MTDIMTMGPSMEQVPPNSIDAERSVLGAVLLNNEVLAHLELRANHFYRTGHQIIYASMLQMDLEAKPIDIITLADQLKKNGELDRAGGGAYIANLTNEVPSVSHAVHHAEIIIKYHTQRIMISACSEVRSDAYDPGADLEELSNRFIDALETESTGLKGMTSGEVMNQTFATYQAMMEGTYPPALQTGLHDLDDMVPIENSDLVIIAGRPGMGKTSFVLAIGRKAARKMPVAIYSLEMKAEQVGQVFIAQETGISRSHIRKRKRITETGFVAMQEACRRHSEMTYNVFDGPGINPAFIRKSAKMMKKKGGLGLIIVDHIGLMDAGKDTNSREEAVGHISRMLKLIAKELNIPVLALSQLNRKCEERRDKKPMLSDLRDSGSIEQDADIVLLVFRPGYYWPTDEPGISAAEASKREEHAGKVQIIAAKQRAGQTGTVTLGWDGPATNVINLAREDRGR